uniref:Uncharacterized protein n=1 Tax=Helicotheca tamesis TaxID=374047 RepID=A0A7S2II05_9STRA|mmetsp:Transcript_9622/g.13447  ORF Transcript_9622/g.13447 Transcript_9622/m.13447 type:complete len:154 (+) Transcript_9622:219-680(+)|eukprot:CAMPEP_0185729404 /NCGR_PEP_ID=MMETSP1171-20130828/5698_1 /TAXON_ID=374046 /ORGANISM="Helicotheca tamensis, Strain CCMP826" /LENGTH=153 /DNA_ID=CAMNT_0028398237 /DNA_START=146 /DNA_END=607 /DNA_ORIENTATION=-
MDASQETNTCGEAVRTKSLKKGSSFRAALRRTSFRKSSSRSVISDCSDPENIDTNNMDDTNDVTKNISERGQVKRPSLRLSFRRGSERLDTDDDSQHKEWEWDTLKRTDSVAKLAEMDGDSESAWTPRAPHPLLTEADEGEETSPGEGVGCPL